MWSERTRADSAQVLITGLVASSMLASVHASRYMADRISRIEQGTTITVRTNQTIDVDRPDRRVYTGVVDRDVYGENRRIAIPRGSSVELMVRRARDNDLILDLESVVANGERYAVRADANRIEADGDRGIIGAIEGAIVGARGPKIRLPRDSVLAFRLDRPLDVGVPDRGIERDGYHWHEWER